MVTTGEHQVAEPSRRSHTRGHWWRLLPDLVVVLAVVFALGAYHFDLGGHWGLARDPAGRPVAIAAQGLSLPSTPGAEPVARPLSSGDAAPGKVRRAIAGALADPRLGGHVRAVVRDLNGSTELFDTGTGTVTPASTMKLLTSVAALASLGPETRFRTTVRRGGGRITLVGGGDPFLLDKQPGTTTYPAFADLTTLARRTAQRLRAAGVNQVRLGYDDSAFTGPTIDSHWPSSYVGDGVVPPITALWADQGRDPGGRGYLADPSAGAAQVFRAALVRSKVRVLGATRHLEAARTSHRIAAVASPPLGQIVARLLLVSDNNAAEVVAHHVGAAEHQGASYAGGAAGVRRVLSRLGISLAGARIYDGSGLSRQDRLSPDTLADVLSTAASPANPKLRQALTGLPVAGFSGSLTYRFDNGDPLARGRVRAKTGTLTGVHGLAGLVTDRDGDLLGFVLVADRVKPADEYYAPRRLDQIAAMLAACHCGRSSSAAAGG